MESIAEKERRARGAFEDALGKITACVAWVLTSGVLFYVLVRQQKPVVLLAAVGLSGVGVLVDAWRDRHHDRGGRRLWTFTVAVVMMGTALVGLL